MARFESKFGLGQTVRESHLAGVGLIYKVVAVTFDGAFPRYDTRLAERPFGATYTWREHELEATK